MAGETETEGRALAAQAGVPLEDERARIAARSLAAPIDAAERFARSLAFEAEPAQFLASQQRAKR